MKGQIQTSGAVPENSGRGVLGDRHPRAAGLLTVDPEGTMQATVCVCVCVAGSVVPGTALCSGDSLSPAVREDWGHRPVIAQHFRVWGVLYSQEPSKLGDTWGSLLKYGDISIY